MVRLSYWADAMKSSVSVVVPTYNEKENIGILVNQIKKALEGRLFEIIVVDDSSPDGTWKIVKKMEKEDSRVRLIEREMERGIGSALRRGYNAAKNDVIISIDADLSFNTGDIKRFLNKIEKDGFDFVVGCRHRKEKAYETKQLSTKLKKMISRYGNTFIRAYSGIPINDYSANFRAIKRSVWEKLKTEDNTNSVLAEMIIKAHYAGFKVCEIDVEFKERKFGQSKINLYIEAPKFMAKVLKHVAKERFLQPKKVSV